MLVTPFDHKRYQAGIEKDMQINLPIRAEFELSRENHEVRAMIQPSNPEQKSKIFTIRNRPYIAQEDMLKLEPAQQHIIHVRKPPTLTNFTVGQDFTGMAFDIDFSSERKFMDFAEVINKVHKKEYMSAILKAISEPIHHWELVVSYNPEKSTAKTVSLSAAYGTFPHICMDKSIHLELWSSLIFVYRKDEAFSGTAGTGREADG